MSDPLGDRQGRRFLLAVGRVTRLLLAAALLTVLVVGMPYGLTYFVGWPLPHRMPSWADVENTLTAPMSATFLTDVMACVLWPVWALFVLDVARATAQAARGFPVPTAPKTSPLQFLAAALVSTVVVSVLSVRSAAPVPAMPASHPVSYGAAAASTTSAPASPTTTAATRPARPAYDDNVTVRGPRNGVYDSLWRIADRTLGDGSRWPEIYALNRGRPQPDGHALTNPDIIRPGWILRLPTGHPANPHNPRRHASPEPRITRPAPKQPITPKPPRRSPDPAPSTSPASPSSSPSAHPVGKTQSPSGSPAYRSPGLSLPTGAFVGAGLAAAIVGALATVWLRRRIRYRPGSGNRDDLTLAPVVRALRIAHDEVAGEGEESTEAEEGAVRAVGVRDGRAVAWDLARTRGLGLIGPGAPGAARALLIRCLTDRPAKVLVPQADATVLLGGAETERRQPDGLLIVEDLAAALDVLESELLGRARASAEPVSDRTLPQGDIVLVATPTGHADRRLQAILDNGSTLGLAGTLLGQWLPGGTLRVRNDGTVAAASPDLADAFTGARLFNLPAADADALLRLLAEAGAGAGSQRPSGPPHPVVDLPMTPGHVPPSPGGTPNRPRPVRRQLGEGSGPSTESGTADKEDEGTVQRNSASPAEGAAHRPPPATSAPPPVTADDKSGSRSLELTVLGRVRLMHHLSADGTRADLSASLAPKHREILTFLALHPGGVRREVLAGAIWPDAPRDRPYNSFHATLSQLRRALRIATRDQQTDVAVHSDGHYALDGTRISVDLWVLHDALRAAREDTDENGLAVNRVLGLYTGDLATEIAAEWIEAPREALRRDVLDVIGTRVRVLRESQPEQALALLERARALDPYNEAVYRGIGRLQARLGRRDAIPRTLALLRTTLAELDMQPAPETIELFTALERPRPAARTRQERAAG